MTDSTFTDDITATVAASENGQYVVVQIDTTGEEDEHGPLGLVVCLNDADLYRNTADAYVNAGNLIECSYSDDTEVWTVSARPDASQSWHVQETGDSEELSTLLSIAHDVATGG
jgi:hypothetical protein